MVVVSASELFCARCQRQRFDGIHFGSLGKFCKITNKPHERQLSRALFCLSAGCNGSAGQTAATMALSRAQLNRVALAWPSGPFSYPAGWLRDERSPPRSLARLARLHLQQQQPSRHNWKGALTKRKSRQLDRSSWRTLHLQAQDDKPSWAVIIGRARINATHYN